MLDIDLTLPRSYEIEEVLEFPGTGKFDVPLLYFPRPKRRREHDGLWIRVRAAGGTTWIGVYAFGYSSPPAFSRVVSTLDPNRVCVISNGAAYIVKADEPETWEQVPVIPVLDMRLLPEHQLLVFTDFTRLTAYASNGFAWRSPQVCWDELKIIKVTHDTIEGTGYDATNSFSNEMRFAVDIKTGRSLFPSPRSVDGTHLW
jgi:hypothetical protein